MVRMPAKNTKKPGEEEELDPDVLDAAVDDTEEDEESEWEDSGGDTDVEEDF